MDAYLKVYKGGAYSENQYFLFFTAAFKEYAGNKCLWDYI